jgi:hypothetical protein
MQDSSNFAIPRISTHGSYTNFIQMSHEIGRFDTHGRAGVQVHPAAALPANQ